MIPIRSKYNILWTARQLTTQSLLWEETSFAGDYLTLADVNLFDLNPPNSFESCFVPGEWSLHTVEWDTELGSIEFRTVTTTVCMI